VPHSTAYVYIYFTSSPSSKSSTYLRYLLSKWVFITQQTVSSCFFFILFNFFFFFSISIVYPDLYWFTHYIPSYLHTYIYIWRKKKKRERQPDETRLVIFTYIHKYIYIIMTCLERFKMLDVDVDIDVEIFDTLLFFWGGGLLDLGFLFDSVCLLANYCHLETGRRRKKEASFLTSLFCCIYIYISSITFRVIIGKLLWCVLSSTHARQILRVLHYL
jgi:hypothetical protein